MNSCCICNKNISIENALKPSVCLIKHGSKSHLICQDCWWNPVSGFAREYANHQCPGCKNIFPSKNNNKTIETIDLTSIHE
jgi:hypothetical protein